MKNFLQVVAILVIAIARVGSATAQTCPNPRPAGVGIITNVSVDVQNLPCGFTGEVELYLFFAPLPSADAYFRSLIVTVPSGWTYMGIQNTQRINDPLGSPADRIRVRFRADATSGGIIGIQEVASCQKGDAYSSVRTITVKRPPVPFNIVGNNILCSSKVYTVSDSKTGTFL